MVSFVFAVLILALMAASWWGFQDAQHALSPLEFESQFDALRPILRSLIAAPVVLLTVLILLAVFAYPADLVTRLAHAFLTLGCWMSTLFSFSAFGLALRVHSRLPAISLGVALISLSLAVLFSRIARFEWAFAASGEMIPLLLGLTLIILLSMQFISFTRHLLGAEQESKTAAR